jgi:hypothetical protein
VAEDVDRERDCNYDEEQDGGEHSGDVEGGAVFLPGRRRGDAEEVNETGGDESQEPHGS